jgi:hypothetical protein
VGSGDVHCLDLVWRLVGGGSLAGPPPTDWVAHARYHLPISKFKYTYIEKRVGRWACRCVRGALAWAWIIASHHAPSGPGTYTYTYPLAYVGNSNFKLKFQFYGSSPGYLLRLMFVYTTRDIYSPEGIFKIKLKFILYISMKLLYGVHGLK